MTLSRNWTLILQGTALAIQILVPTIPGFPQAWVPFMHGLVSLLQGWQALIAHNSPPSGGKKDAGV